MKYEEFLGKKVIVKLENGKKYTGWLFYGARYGCARQYIIIPVGNKTLYQIFTVKDIKEVKLYDDRS